MTKKSSQITVAQKYQFFKKYQEGLKFLHEKNPLRCGNLGRNFGALIQHFIVGNYKTCLIVNVDGDEKIVGGSQKGESREYFLSFPLPI